MKSIGLTGGIGSGKSTLAKIFAQTGTPVYYSDQASKRLLNESPELKLELIRAFGSEIYRVDGQINKTLFADIIFSDNKKLEIANQIIWPFVGKDFQNWIKNQNAPFVIRESALLFESGAHRKHTANIVAHAPRELRIQRVMKRDNTGRNEVLRRIKKQMPQTEKNKQADFIVINDGKRLIIPQVLEIRKKILNF